MKQQERDPQQIHSLPMRGKLNVNGSDTYLAACWVKFGIIQAPALPVSLHYADCQQSAERTQKLMEWVAETRPPYWD